MVVGLSMATFFGHRYEQWGLISRHIGVCNHANQLAELKCYEDELAWQRMKSEHELERQHNGELVQMQE